MAGMELFPFVWCPNFDQNIEDLADMARPERWDFVRDEQTRTHQILRNYVNHTFMRLQELHEQFPDKHYIEESENFYCFNTGLFTKNFEQIFALFIPNTPGFDQEWKMKGFFKESAYEMRQVANLPERAVYFDRASDLIYDTRLELRVNIDHILEDEENRDRIPEEYRNKANLSINFTGSALKYAKVRIQENYKAAVPQYFNGRIQLLIPISLDDPSVVDLALAVERENGYYIGQTCLTLDMAYNNARLIARPESDWLTVPGDNKFR